MDRPLCYAVGNSLEVIEAIETLRGGGPADLLELSLALSAQILYLAERGSLAQCRAMAERALSSGEALRTFEKMVQAQGGDVAYVQDPTRFALSPFRREVKAAASGYITRVNTEQYGLASLLLGAGRNTKEDEIDLGAGYVLCKKTGDAVKKGETLAVMYAASEERLDSAERVLLQATEIGGELPRPRPLIFETV
jgi:pyrimidine-nucleoside phosphorylase